MYRAAAKISDGQIDTLVGRFCRSQAGAPGCLRTILWARDATGARPSLRLPLDKFIAPLDQTGRGEKVMPLLCQEACNLLVAEARKVVKGDPVVEEPEREAERSFRRLRVSTLESAPRDPSIRLVA